MSEFQETYVIKFAFSQASQTLIACYTGTMKRLLIDKFIVEYLTLTFILATSTFFNSQQNFLTNVLQNAYCNIPGM